MLASIGNGGCDPNCPRHSRQVFPLRNSFATMQTGRGRSPERPAASKVSWPPNSNSKSTATICLNGRRSSIITPRSRLMTG